MKTYILNGNNHFFIVKVPVDVAKLRQNGCMAFGTLNQLYEAVRDETEQELDEVEGAEFVIDIDSNDRLRCVDARGMIEYLSDTIEFQRGGLAEYIYDYQL